MLRLEINLTWITFAPSPATMSFRSLLILPLFTAFLFSKGFAQDSLYIKSVHTADSAYRFENHSLDSIQKNFRHCTDSVQRAYAAPMKELDSKIGRLNHKSDSLNKLKLPTTSVTHSIDSLEREQAKTLNELNNDIAKIKKETLAGVSSLHLPPQAQGEVNSLTKNIGEFSVPKNFFSLPSFNMKSLGLSGITPSLSVSNASIPSLQKFNLASPQLPSLAQLEGSLGSDLNKIKSLQSQANAKVIEQDAMKVASQNAEIKSVVQEQNKVNGVEKEMGALKNPKAADSLAMTQLKPTVNHFAGKEKELQLAMSSISKYKQKYSNIKSLTKLPKRPPNPLKDKPWYERVVPGLNYFIQSKHYALVDLNPSLGWKFNPHLTASLGWNQRIGVSHGVIGTARYDRVYGVRSTVSYSWKHGFIFQVSPELMNAYIPTGGSMDIKHQAVLFGVYSGVRKNFPVYKNLSCYSEGLYHFSQVSGQNIYGDRVVFRFGLEYNIKKKNKATAANVLSKNLGNELSFKGSFNIVTSTKKFGVTNLKGDTIVPAKYSKIKKLVVNKKLFFIVRQEKNYGAFDQFGKPSVPISFPTGVQVKAEIINREIGKMRAKIQKTMKASKT